MMSKISDLILITGLDIELKNPSVRIHQPKLSEIALIGEDNFFRSMNIFYIKPEPLIEFIQSLGTINDSEKEMWLESATPYDNLLFLIQTSLMGEEDKTQVTDLVKIAFKLMIPTHTFVYNEEANTMLLMADNKSHSIVVDGDLFLRLRNIAEQIFLLSKFFGEQDVKKLSPAAQKIADKMAASEKKIKRVNGEEDSENSQFARILSIMGVKYELDYLSNLTIYQLYNQFERYNLFLNYNQGVQASLAGASNVELVDWYKKI